MLVQTIVPHRPETGLERCHNSLRSNSLAAVLIIAIVLWGSHVFRRGPVVVSEGRRAVDAAPWVPGAINYSRPQASVVRTAPHYQVCNVMLLTGPVCTPLGRLR